MEDTSNDSISDIGVGALLRASRIRIGEDLGDISKTLKIRYPYLTAIEEDRFDALPGQPYVVGFIRAYADHLGLDSEEVVRRFKNEFSVGEQRQAELSFLKPIAETTVPSGAIVFIGLFVSILTYGFWYFSTSDENYLADLVEPLPERLASLINSDENVDPNASIGAQKTAAPSDESGLLENLTPSNSSAPQIKEGTEQDGSPTNVFRETKLPKEVISNELKPILSEPGVVTDVDTKPPQKVEPAENITEVSGRESISTPLSSSNASVKKELQIASKHNVNGVSEKIRDQVEASGSSNATPNPAPKIEKLPRILVRARVSSWIQVQDDFSNEILLTRLLKAGEEYGVPDKPGLRLLTGNAGALEILVDGDAVPAIGEEGAVRRGVQLDPSLLKAGTAVSE